MMVAISIGIMGVILGVLTLVGWNQVADSEAKLLERRWDARNIQPQVYQNVTVQPVATYSVNDTIYEVY